MVSLKKPETCTCGGTKLKRMMAPERWVCQDCDIVVAERPSRRAVVACSKCGASPEEKPFRKDRHMCLDCFNDYMRDWRERNPDWNSDPDYRRRRNESAKKSVRRSPEAFLQHLWTRASRGNAHFFTLRQDELFDLYKRQNGRCALTGLPLVHGPDDLCSISMDRINHLVGFVSGNVRLICQWVNLAQRDHSDEEFLAILRELIRTGLPESSVLRDAS